MENYTKERDLMPMIRKMKELDITAEAPSKTVGTTTGTGKQAVTSPLSDIDRDQYKMDYQAHTERE